VARAPQALLSFMLERLSVPRLDRAVYDAFLEYVQTGAWTGSDAQVATKAAGLAHLIAASAAYQVV